MKVRIVTDDDDLIASELARRLEAEGHQLATDPRIADAAVFVRPSAPQQLIELGILLGRREPAVLLVGPKEAEAALPEGVIRATSIREVIDALRIAGDGRTYEPLDEARLRANEACKEGLEWFVRRYPQGATLERWNREEQIAALKDGGGRWVPAGATMRLLPLWPMEGTDFSAADLNGAQLKRLSLANTIFDDATLVRSAFCGSDLQQASFRRANLQRADFREADLRNASFDDANLERANFRKARLEGARFERANLTAVSFQDAALTGVDLSGATLTNARLRGADLSSSNMSGADLRAVNLMHANLKGANLAGADLRRANLAGANWDGALIENAFFEATHLEAVKGKAADGS